MTSNTQLLKIAEKHIGQGGAVFRKFCGLPSNAAWCNAFVDYIAHEGGVSALYFNGKKMTYCPTSIKWCNSNLAQVPLYWAMPMDIIYFDWEKNGVPNHIGFVRAVKDSGSIYTVEGNTDGGRVANKTRAGKYVQGVYRPHFSGTFNNKPLSIDGAFQFQSVGGLQKALKALKCYDGQIDTILGKQTVRALQKFCGVSQDGAIGPKTARAIQTKICGFKGKAVDGQIGKQTTMAVQRWINANAFQAAPAKPATTTPVKKKTNADKLVAEMSALAWAYGTAKSKYAYKTGAPKAACKTAMRKYGYNTKTEYSDCGDFVNTVVREAGIDKSFVVQRAVKAKFPPAGSHFSVVLKGKKIPSGFLKAGDIIRYKKKSNKGQHAMFYFGGGKICDAGYHNRFGNIRKDDKRYAGSNVKISTIEVLRAK